MRSFLSIIITLVFSFPLWGQEQFKLEGRFKLGSSRIVKYTMTWKEQEKTLEGTYQDDYFGEEGKVSGRIDEFGRNFMISFPTETKGVKSINLLSSRAGSRSTGTTIPVSLVIRDSRGNPIELAKSSSQLVSINPVIAQKQEEAALCREGFGALQGYCGEYQGTITEKVDRDDQCNLLFAEAVRLELDFSGELNLYLGLRTGVVTIPYHQIGRIPSNPESLSIDVLSRNCAPLSGTSFSNDNCKRLHLIGRFSLRENTRHFTGVYSITDELTNNVCRYSLSMDRSDQ